MKMSYIPDCRSDEFYNDKYVEGADKEFLRGFDWCVEFVVDNFFNNNLDETDEDTHLAHTLSEEVIEHMKETYEVYHSYGDEKVETRKVETYVDLLRMKLLEWIESERDMLVTSMLDGMAEEEYNKVKERVDGQSEAEN